MAPTIDNTQAMSTATSQTDCLRGSFLCKHAIRYEPCLGYTQLFLIAYIVQGWSVTRDGKIYDNGLCNCHSEDFHVGNCDSSYKHAFMQAYMHTCIHAYMHPCMHTCIHAYMHTCMHACMHAYIHTYIHTYRERLYKHTHRIPGARTTSLAHTLE